MSQPLGSIIVERRSGYCDAEACSKIEPHVLVIKEILWSKGLENLDGILSTAVHCIPLMRHSVSYLNECRVHPDDSRLPGRWDLGRGSGKTVVKAKYPTGLALSFEYLLSKLGNYI